MVVACNLGKMRLVCDYNFASRTQTHSSLYLVWRTNRRLTPTCSLEKKELEAGRFMQALLSREGVLAQRCVFFTPWVSLSWPPVYGRWRRHHRSKAPSIAHRIMHVVGRAGCSVWLWRCGAVQSVPWWDCVLGAGTEILGSVQGGFS